MHEPILNGLVVVIWLLALFLFIVRRMEKKGLRFKFEQIENGLQFEYRLGVYGGTIRLIRDPESTEPHVAGNVFGWEFKFPTSFTNAQMLEYVQYCGPTCQKNQSHSKDLIIFNEVVNNHNDALVSINGEIYVYDNSDHRPFQVK